MLGSLTTSLPPSMRGRGRGRFRPRVLAESALELGGSDAFIVLDDADMDTAISEPVALVFGVDGERDAIRLANDSPYGLGGTVITRDIERGKADRAPDRYRHGLDQRGDLDGA